MSLDDLIARSLRIKAEGAAARGNGRLHAVPAAVEQMMLTAALGKITEIEKTLEDARDAARAAARRAGLSGSHLFEATSFIPRSTGHRWAAEARAAGGEQRVQEIIRAFSQPPNPALRAWADRMLRRRRAAGIPDDVELTPDQSHALLCGGELVPADEVETQAEAEAAARARSQAEAILAAGERARSDGSNERPAPTGLAAKVIAAGKARRVPFGDENK